MFIIDIRPEIIRNSRRENTIKIEIDTYAGKFVASAPSGKSKGRHEIPAYSERGLNWSFKLLSILARRLKYKNFMLKNFDGLKEFESEIRKFEQKYGKIGANCVYALETCFLKAAAKENKKELWRFLYDSFNPVKNKKSKPKIPLPVGNCIGGGLHSKDKKTKIPDFQEFLIIPNLKKGESFSRAVTKNLHAYERAKTLIKKNEKRFTMKRNDEGAWKTSLTNEEVLEILYQIGKDFNLKIGIDVAASSFCGRRGYYNYENKKLTRDKQEQVDYMKRLIDKYNLFYLEDPFNEDDFSGFKALASDLKDKKRNVLIVGDDLTVTNLMRTRRAHDAEAINSMIIKPNQIGSLLHVRKVVDFCKDNKIKIIFSHRSGETMDDALADYCIGFQGDFIKAGIYGKERLIKLRRVIEIEKSLKRNP